MLGPICSLRPVNGGISDQPPQVFSLIRVIAVCGTWCNVPLMMSLISLLLVAVNPVALRMAKTLWSFGHSECSRVKHGLNNLFACCSSFSAVEHVNGGHSDQTTQVFSLICHCCRWHMV